MQRMKDEKSEGYSALVRRFVARKRNLGLRLLRLSLKLSDELSYVFGIFCIGLGLQELLQFIGRVRETLQIIPI